jgi:hypothetical protein
MRETLSSKLGDVVSLYEDRIIPDISYIKTRSTIHTSAVKLYIDSAGINSVLGTKPPPVHPSEEFFPRPTHCTLAKLRSRKCSSLHMYQFFIKKVNDDTYQSCHADRQTTNHLFSCPSSPTTLTVIDSWLHPVAAAEFILSLPDLNHLPPSFRHVLHLPLNRPLDSFLLRDWVSLEPRVKYQDGLSTMLETTTTPFTPFNQFTLFTPLTPLAPITPLTPFTQLMKLTPFTQSTHSQSMHLLANS